MRTFTFILIYFIGAVITLILLHLAQKKWDFSEDKENKDDWDSNRNIFAFISTVWPASWIVITLWLLVWGILKLMYNFSSLVERKIEKLW